MDEKTARTYRENKILPSQSQHARDYRTRKDPFYEVWSEVQARLETEPRLQAKTLLAWLQERYPGQFPDSTRRTFERRVRLWRSTYGPAKKVIFPQVHHPGRIAASDFTVMNSLNVRIAGSVFDQLPLQKIDTNETLHSILVHSSSTILIRCNRYSVPSRLIGEKVNVTIRAEWIDVSHHGNHVQCMPRLMGSGGSAINYRHVIDSLVRKPGAFQN